MCNDIQNVLVFNLARALLAIFLVPLVPGNSSGNAYGNHRVALIPVPFPFR